MPPPRRYHPLARGTRCDTMGPGLVEGNADAKGLDATAALNAKGLECNRRGDIRGALTLSSSRRTSPGDDFGPQWTHTSHARGPSLNPNPNPNPNRCTGPLP